MTDVLAVTAGELGDPVRLGVEVEGGYGLVHGSRFPFRPCDRACIRPRDQLLKMIFRDGAHVDDRNPVISGQVAGRLDTRNIRQRQEQVRRHANAESPSFRLTCLEVRELPPSGVENKHVAGRVI